MIKLLPVKPTTYARSLGRAWDARAEIRASVTDYRDVASIPRGAACYLSEDSASGFMITTAGEIIGVFSTVKGRGDDLVRGAIERGGDHLDCFDGYLVSLYTRHGFRETRREANWTAGGPDVVYLCTTRCCPDFTTGE